MHAYKDFMAHIVRVQKLRASRLFSVYKCLRLILPVYKCFQLITVCVQMFQAHLCIQMFQAHIVCTVYMCTNVSRSYCLCIQMFQAHVVCVYKCFKFILSVYTNVSSSYCLCIQMFQARNARFYFRCDDEKCRNVRGFWLPICLASICSLPLRSDTDATDGRIRRFSPCPSKCNADELNMTDYLQCIRNHCPSDDSPLDHPNTDQDQSLKLSNFDPEQSNSVLPGDGDQFLPGKRVPNDSLLKSCLVACSVYALKNPRSNTTYCVNRFCAKLKHTQGLSSYIIDKRWSNRVCMETHCRPYEADINSYVACGMTNCG